MYTIAFLQNDANKEVFNVGKGSFNPTGISNQNSEIPEAYSLSQNYPNPFNPSTNVELRIPKDGFVTLKLFDALGREVQNLVEGTFKAGSYKIFIDGSSLSSGLYFYKMTAGEFTSTRKMMLIK
jgi:hypothetical protein